MKHTKQTRYEKWYISDLAQHMWEDDLHCTNLYKTFGNKTNIYEGKVVDLLEKLEACEKEKSTKATKTKRIY